jgi:hypothetical protein
MFVPSYQMHNVLNVYSKQLRHNMTSATKKNLSEKLPVDQVSLTPEGKRRTTIEKVSKDILEKITRFVTQKRVDQQPGERAQEEVQKETATDGTNESAFVYNVIDTINQKRRNTLSVENSSFLIKRFEPLSNEDADKKMESWV